MYYFWDFFFDLRVGLSTSSFCSFSLTVMKFGIQIKHKNIKVKLKFSIRSNEFENSYIPFDYDEIQLSGVSIYFLRSDFTFWNKIWYTNLSKNIEVKFGFEYDQAILERVHVCSLDLFAVFVYLLCRGSTYGKYIFCADLS